MLRKLHTLTTHSHASRAVSSGMHVRAAANAWTTYPMHAAQSRAACTFVQPPTLEQLAEIGQKINTKEIPRFDAAKPGLRIPEERECVSSQAYQLLG